MEARWYNVRHTRVRALVAGQGPHVLFLHGTGGNGKTWYHQIRRLAESCTTIAVDLPGYGESELPGWLQSVDDYVPFLLEWMDQAGWGPCVVVGNSMGGRLALRLALDHPERVSGLVLVNSAGLVLPEHPIASPATMTPREFVEAIFFRPSPAVRPPAGTPPWQATMDRLNAGPRQEDIGARLGELRVPTLIVWGEHDRLIPRAHAEAFHAGIAGAELVWVPRAGHVPMLERPSPVNEALAAFVATKRSG